MQGFLKFGRLTKTSAGGILGWRTWKTKLKCEVYLRLCCVHLASGTLVRFPTCIVLCQVFIFVLLLFLAEPSTAGLLLLFGFLHGDASDSPSTERERQNLL